MATHSSILAWRNTWTEEPGGLESVGSQRVRQDWAINTLLLIHFKFWCFHLTCEEKLGWGRQLSWNGILGNATWYFSLVLFKVSERDFPGGSNGNESTCFAGDLGSIPGLGLSPGEGYGNPLQYSCLKNLMDRGTSWATVHRVTNSWTRLKRLRTHALAREKIASLLVFF